MINVTIVNLPFLAGDVPCSTSYGVYISQLIRFDIASSHVADFIWYPGSGVVLDCIDSVSLYPYLISTLTTNC